MSVNLNSITPVGPGWKRLPSVHRGYPLWRHESGVEAELYHDEGNGYLWAAELFACEDGAEEEAGALIRAAFHQQRAPEASDDDIPPHLQKAVEQARRHGQFDVLRLGADTPFWLLDVFKRLLDIADHARFVHNCDRHGYEVDHAAVEAGKELLVKMLDILEAATAAEAAAEAATGEDTQK